MKKIARADNRFAKILFEDNTPVIIPVIKTIVNNKFFDVRVNNTIEIKVLFVIDVEIRKGKG